MAKQVRTDRWHNTGGNGPASEVWVRKRSDKSVVISVHRNHVLVDHWERNDADASDPFAPRWVRTQEGAFRTSLNAAKKEADTWLGVVPRKSRAKLKAFTVVGFYVDNKQPFLSWENALTAKLAADYAITSRKDNFELEVAVVEVINGHHRGILENKEVIRGN